jgi:hypothetical protein
MIPPPPVKHFTTIINMIFLALAVLQENEQPPAEREAADKEGKQ